MKHPRPNFVFIITDQQRYDHLGCNGHSVIQTPNIDRIARDGVSFDRHYCNHPLCTPSRCTVITGRHPSSHRVYDNGLCLPDSETTLPQVLGESGYDTRAIGKLHFSSWREPNAVSFESESFWASGRGPREPVPYVGFDFVEICTRHINPETGHYGYWLDQTFPDVKKHWDDYLSPHPSGASDTYDWTMPPEAHANTWIADRCVRYLEERAGAEEPFFLHVGFPDPHHPFRAPDPWGSMYDPADVVLPDTSLESHERRPPEYKAFVKGVLNEETLGAGDFNNDDLTKLTEEQLRVIHAKTYGMVSFVDDQVKRVLDALEKTGLADDTIVVYTTDHGDYMGDHGLIKKAPFLLEGLVKIPFLMSGPEELVGRGRRRDLTAHVDVMPTLLDLAGVPVPVGVEGRSFTRELRGETPDDPREAVLIESLHQFQFDRNVKGLVTDDWKLVYWGGQTYGELYDLVNDPTEKVNLWDDPTYRKKRSELLESLLREVVVNENILPLPLAPT